MKRELTIAAIACVIALSTGIIGCKSSGSSNNTTGGTPTGPSPGTYAGTFEGKVCGRDLDMTITQNGLNRSGNSLVGTRALELFTTKTGVSIF